MNTLIELLQLPFVQRAVMAGIVLALLTAVLGVLTLIRKAAFYGDAIAHSSLAGVAIGLWLGWYPLATALLYAVGISMLLPTIRTRLKLPLDNVLGIILPASMGLGVILFNLLPGFQPEMMSFLFGSMVTIRESDLVALFLLALISLAFFALYLPRLFFLSLDPEYASLLKIPTKWLERAYEMILAATIIAGVKLLGVILVSALLIVPASAAKLHATSLKSWVILTVIIGQFVVIGGLGIAMLLNVPPGATIAVFSAVIFAISALIRLLR